MLFLTHWENITSEFITFNGSNYHILDNKANMHGDTVRNTKTEAFHTEARQHNAKFHQDCAHQAMETQTLPWRLWILHALSMLFKVQSRS